MSEQLSPEAYKTRVVQQRFADYVATTEELIANLAAENAGLKQQLQERDSEGDNVSQED